MTDQPILDDLLAPPDLDAKRHHRAQEAAEREKRRGKRRAQRKRSLRCFWAAPWGHAWVLDNRSLHARSVVRRCVACQKRQVFPTHGPR